MDVPCPAPADPDLDSLIAFRDRGDREALARLLVDATPTAFFLASRRLGNASDAEDAVQMAFVDAIACCRSFRGGSRTVRGWLLTIVLNRCRKMQRSAIRREYHEAASPTPMPPIEPCDPELVSAIHAAVGELPEHERTVIELRFLAGLEFRDVAAALNIKEKTIRAQVVRGLDRLRELLRRRGIGPVEPGMMSAALLLPLCSLPDTLPATVTIIAHAAPTPGTAATPGVLVGLLAGLTLMVAGITWMALPSGAVGSVAAEPQPLPMVRPPLVMPSGLRVIGRGTFQAPANIQGLAFSPDSRLLAAGCPQHVVIWDMPSGTTRLIVNEASSAYAAHWRTPSELVYLVSSNHPELVVYDIAKTRERLRIRLPVQDLRDFSLDPTGRYCAIPVGAKPSMQGASYGGGAGVAVVDIKTGLIDTVADGVVRQLSGATCIISSAAISPDGQRIAFIDRLNGWNGNAARPAVPVRVGILDRGTRKIIGQWDLAESQSILRPVLAWTGETVHVSSFLPQEKRWTVRSDPKADIGIGVPSADASAATSVPVDDRTVANPGATMLPAGWSTSMVALSTDGRWCAAAASGRQQAGIVDMKNHQLLAPAAGTLASRPRSATWCDDGRLLLGVHDGMWIVPDEGPEQIIMTKEHRVDAPLRTIARLTLSAGGQSGQPVAWDLVSGNQIGVLQRSIPLAVDAMWLSPTGLRAVVKSENSHELTLHDLTRNQQTGVASGLVHHSFGRIFHVTDAVWNSDETQLFLADNTAVWFSSEDRAASGITGPIALSGGYDPTSGRQRFAFRDATGAPIEAVECLALAPDGSQLYVRTAVHHAEAPASDHDKPGSGLCDATTGTWIRTLPDPGAQPGYTPDGSLIVGRTAAIDPMSGTIIAAYPKDGLVAPSPTRTWVAVVRPGPSVALHDARTGIQRWSMSFDDQDLAHATPDSISWDAGEHRLAVLFKNRTYVARIELFPMAEPAADLKAAIDALAVGDEPTARVAVLGLISAKEKAASALARPSSHLEVMTLEQLARNGVQGAEAALLTAAQNGSMQVAARDALARLAAGSRATARALVPPSWQMESRAVEVRSDF